MLDYSDILKALASDVVQGFIGEKIGAVLAGKRLELPPWSELAEEVSAAKPATEFSDSGSESLRFILHQRFRLRIDLARAKWDWLIVGSYFHPSSGFPTDNREVWSLVWSAVNLLLPILRWQPAARNGYRL